MKKNVGPEWRGLEDLLTPSPIVWKQRDKHAEVWIGPHKVGWLERRPHYCDRGRVVVNCMLPGLDWADGFPRYYMSEAVGISETEAFLRWRLWQQR